MTEWNPSQVELVGLLPRTGRGPRREGIYALWLLLRVAQDLLLEPPLGERAVRRRLASLEARFSSLTIPPPLRRALAAALLQLREGGSRAVPAVLSNLVAPARETTGAEAAEAIQRASRGARQVASNPSR
jgi:hypothetical protein